MCDSGKWICSNRKCPRTCSVTGMGHYRTFDGKQFDLKSNCEYILVEVSHLKNITLKILYIIENFSKKTKQLIHSFIYHIQIIII